MTHYTRILIETKDALGCSWGNPDFVLMNPPFTSYQKMSESDRKAVRTILGKLAKGRPDKSMAFIWQAVQVLKPGAIVASVLPSVVCHSDDRLSSTARARLTFSSMDSALADQIKGLGFLL